MCMLNAFKVKCYSSQQIWDWTTLKTISPSKIFSKHDYYYWECHFTVMYNCLSFYWHNLSLQQVRLSRRILSIYKNIFLLFPGVDTDWSTTYHEMQLVGKLSFEVHSLLSWRYFSCQSILFPKRYYFSFWYLVNNKR